MPGPMPVPSDVTTEFWEATTRHEYLVQRCTACDAAIFYPREVCPRCLLSDHLMWVPASGRGTVYAATVHHRPGVPEMADEVPYVVALVDLDEGIRVMTNVVGCEPDDVQPGMAVALTWQQLENGWNLPLFQPREGSDGDGA